MKLDVAGLKELKYSELRLYIYLNIITRGRQKTMRSYKDIHDEIGIGVGTITKISRELVRKGLIIHIPGAHHKIPSIWEVVG